MDSTSCLSLLLINTSLVYNLLFFVVVVFFFFMAAVQVALSLYLSYLLPREGCAACVAFPE